jgi:hypothetical protein
MAMDDEEIEVMERPDSQRHDKWSFIVLAVDLMANISAQITDTLTTATTLLLQHREHKIEEDEFFEVVKEL